MAVDVYSDIDILKGMSMLEKIARFFVLIGEDSTVKIFQFQRRSLWFYSTHEPKVNRGFVETSNRV